MWCTISQVGIIGPYFFQENGRAVTVNSDHYLTMLQEFFQPAFKAMQLQDTWFQQDGATSHTAHVTMNFLRQTFPGRLMSLRGDLKWPARSPDLAPCDFFERVHENFRKWMQQCVDSKGRHLLDTICKTM